MNLDDYINHDDYDVTIQVSDYSRSVGDYTITQIMEVLEAERQKDRYARILVDFTGLTIIGASTKDNMSLLLKMIVKYNCDVRGLNEHITDELTCYIHSNSYLLDTDSPDVFLDAFIQSIYHGDPERIRVKDNFYADSYVQKELVIHLGFKGSRYFYLRIPPYSTEPELLQTLPLEDILKVEHIHITDLLAPEYKFRDGVGETEFQILDLFNKILSERQLEAYIQDKRAEHQLTEQL